MAAARKKVKIIDPVLAQETLARLIDSYKRQKSSINLGVNHYQLRRLGMAIEVQLDALKVLLDVS